MTAPMGSGSSHVPTPTTISIEELKPQNLNASVEGGKMKYYEISIRGYNGCRQASKKLHW